MHIFIYGDSNTFGYDPRDWRTGRFPQEKIWTSVMGSLLPEAEISVDGMNGRELPQGSWDYGYIEAVIRKRKPIDMVIMMLGTNDVMNDPGITEEELLERVTTSIDFLRRTAEACGGTDVKTLIMAPPPIDIPELPFECPIIERFPKLYAEAADKTGSLFFDAYSLKPGLLYDGAHLSEDGHRKLGEAMAAFLA